MEIKMSRPEFIQWIKKHGFTKGDMHAMLNSGYVNMSDDLDGKGLMGVIADEAYLAAKVVQHEGGKAIS